MAAFIASQQLLYKVACQITVKQRDFQGKVNPSEALCSLCAALRALSIKATKQTKQQP